MFKQVSLLLHTTQTYTSFEVFLSIDGGHSSKHLNWSAWHHWILFLLWTDYYKLLCFHYTYFCIPFFPLRLHCSWLRSVYLMPLSAISQTHNH
jgi:hypothetical protein